MRTARKIGYAAGAIAIAAAASWLWLHRAERRDPAFAAVLRQFAASGAEEAQPGGCAACHAAAAELWRASHHAVANAALVTADHERLLGGSVQPEGRHMDWRPAGRDIVLHEDGVPPHPVVGTIGVTPLIQYLLLAPDGRIQTHDIAWDTLRGEWFSVFERDDTEPRVPGEWGHWTGQGMNWDANCAYCHMTAYRKNYDTRGDIYRREWAHMAITCSQCHPGMDVHLAQIRNGNKYLEEQLTPVQHMENCAACHSRRDELTAHRFATGDRYEDHFQLTLADMEGIYHPDGQVIGENYVFGSLTMSRMGTAGITCLDCHDPHSGGFILPVDNNALCQRCHGSGLKDAPRIDPLQHSRHPADSSGNLCIECHMPITTYMGRDPRRDHSFSIPDPRLNLEMGIPDACSACHNTQSVEWSRDKAESWYGQNMNQRRRERARLMRAVWDGAGDGAARLRAAIGTEPNRFWKATYVMMFSQTAPDAGSRALLEALLADPDPLVRSAAVRVLGTDSVDAGRRAALLSDPVRSVRIAAALSITEPAALAPSVSAEVREYLEHTADSPMGALRLADHAGRAGDTSFARELCRRAPRFDARNPEAWRLAAIQLYATGDAAGALDLLREGLAVEPGNALILFNRGLLHAEAGDTAAALADLQAAVGSDPRLEDAWYNLVVLYWQAGRMDTARAKLAEALQAVPAAQRLRQLARQMPPAE